MATRNRCDWESLVRGPAGKARPVTARPEGLGASGRDAGVSNSENRAKGMGREEGRKAKGSTRAPTLNHVTDTAVL